MSEPASKRDRKRLHRLLCGRSVPACWRQKAVRRGWLTSELMRFPCGCEMRWFFTPTGILAAGLPLEETPHVT